MRVERQNPLRRRHAPTEAVERQDALEVNRRLRRALAQPPDDFAGVLDDRPERHAIVDVVDPDHQEDFARPARHQPLQPLQHPGGRVPRDAAVLQPRVPEQLAPGAKIRKAIAQEDRVLARHAESLEQLDLVAPVGVLQDLERGVLDHAPRRELAFEEAPAALALDEGRRPREQHGIEANRDESQHGDHCTFACLPANAPRPFCR